MRLQQKQVVSCSGLFPPEWGGEVGASLLVLKVEVCTRGAHGLTWGHWEEGVALPPGKAAVMVGVRIAGGWRPGESR